MRCGSVEGRMCGAAPCSLVLNVLFAVCTPISQWGCAIGQFDLSIKCIGQDSDDKM